MRFVKIPWLNTDYTIVVDSVNIINIVKGG